MKSRIFSLKRELIEVLRTSPREREWELGPPDLKHAKEQEVGI